MSGVQKGAQRASGGAPADGAAARNARGRGGAAEATGMISRAAIVQFFVETTV